MLHVELEVEAHCVPGVGKIVHHSVVPNEFQAFVGLLTSGNHEPALARGYELQ